MLCNTAKFYYDKESSWSKLQVLFWEWYANDKIIKLNANEESTVESLDKH